jgi:hypothetical protein
VTENRAAMEISFSPAELDSSTECSHRHPDKLPLEML